MSRFTPHKTILFSLLMAFVLPCSGRVQAQESALEVPPAETKTIPTEQSAASSSDIVARAWEASSKSDLTAITGYVNDMLARYGEAIEEQQKNLVSFPARGTEAEFQQYNDYGTILFVQAEALMNRGQREEAIALFQRIIDQFPWAQAWDPSRGNYWSVAEKAQDSINVLTGKAEDDIQNNQTVVKRTRPILHKPGKEQVIDYTKYGVFQNVGEHGYHYSIKDREGLMAALGEGIYPNTQDIFRNPRYIALKKEGKLDGNHWDYVNSDDLEAAYFKWATAPEPWGTRLFYIGMILEKAGLYYHALKAYHALVVHYPKSVAWTYWQTPWYPGQAAIAKIKYIIQTHPELSLDYKWMEIKVKKGFDNDVTNDEFVTYPGRIFKRSWVDNMKDQLQLTDKVELGSVKKQVGSGKVQLVQYSNGHWRLLVNGKPYVIKGVTYAPTKVGQSPDKGTLANWMEEDDNKNGKADGPYDSWVDKNGNNKQDEDEPIVGDFQLLKDMGVNTLRLYHHPDVPNKELLRKMHKEYGFRVIMGDFLGKYTLGSGASWREGTDYENPEHRKKMMESVQQMVMEHKDEPYMLMWTLGNENNYGVASNADKKPEAYFTFANEVAQWIKSVDPHHPVALTNGDTLFLDLFARYAPDIDIFSANVYRGEYGFGSFWEQVADAAGKPAFISEYGCPAYAPHLTLDEADQAQAQYHKGNWSDIANNMAGKPRGMGNALGGVVFEWLDEWWKNYEPFRHDRKSDAIGPFPGGYYFEEWFGIVGQGNGRYSPFLRQPRKAYEVYRELWNQ